MAPEVCANRDLHENAWKLRHSRFYLPQHQSLRSKDILNAVFQLYTGNVSRALEQFDLKFNETREQWNSMMYQVGQSNLLQSWAYGQSKSKIEGWKVSRIVICKFKKPVAFAQILEKQFAFFRLIRINRGPLLLEDSNPEMQEDVAKLMVKKLGGWKKGRLIFFTPELPLTGKILVLMTKLSFYKFTFGRWESIWVDLDGDRSELRNRLNSKWRNKLSIAERQKLRFETHCDVHNFEWLVNRCYEMMKDRGKSIPSKLYHQLLLNFNPNNLCKF